MTPNGKELIVGPKFERKSSECIDMETGIRKPFSLMKSGKKVSLRRLCISPDGQFVAFRGHGGDIYIMDTKTKEFVKDFSMNDQCRSVCFSADSRNLLSHGEGGQCYIWDVKASKLVTKFYDEGTIFANVLAVSPNQQFLATGSEAGVVNLYDYRSAMMSNDSNSVQPLKSFMNLTTGIRSITFNHSSELMAFSSIKKPNCVKIAHVASRSVFSNFPPKEPLERVGEVRFSPSSGFLALGGNAHSIPVCLTCI